MKSKFLGLAVVSLFLAGWAGIARAQDDNRIIGKFDQAGPHSRLRTASVYLTFKDDKAEGLPSLPAGEETRSYIKVWDGLYLQATTRSADNGVAAYQLTFSSDEADQDPLKSEESADDPSLGEVAASDFRTDDNFDVRPLHPGPGTPQDRGVFRIIHYPGFDAEIRVLEFSIGDAHLQKKPFFKSLACLVTVQEKESKGRSKK